MDVNFKVYPRKIDIYLRNSRGFWVYETSTRGYETCKSAKENFCVKHGLDKTQVKAQYDHSFSN